MILSCGEALIDFVPVHDENGGLQYRPSPGGSPYNTAIALGRLGIPVSFCCGLSKDFFGKILLSCLQKSGVQTQWVQGMERDTTLAFVSAESADSEVEYAFYCKETADFSLLEKNLPANLSDEVSMLQLGSVSLVLEPIATTLEKLIFRESSKRLISLDPNIRPVLIPYWDSYRIRFENWLDHIDLLKASVTDLEWLYPQISSIDAVKSILKHRVSVVFLTAGDKGAWAYTEEYQVFFEAEHVQVLDAVGAGDSFHAGVLCRLWKQGRIESGDLTGLQEKELEDCLSFASRVASVTCSRSGADSPWREELNY